MLSHTFSIFLTFLVLSRTQVFLIIIITTYVSIIITSAEFVTVGMKQLKATNDLWQI